jgi:two-component system sensor histidine kinase TtrS
MMVRSILKTLAANDTHRMPVDNFACEAYRELFSVSRLSMPPVVRRILLTLLLPAAGLAQAADSRPVITVGLIDTFSPDFYIKTYSPTLDHLIGALPQYRFNIVEIDYRSIESDLARLRPSFIVSSASTYLSLMQKVGAHQVATKEPKVSPDVSHTVASVVLVPQASPVKTFKDLSRRVIAASDTTSFDGWIIAMGEVAKLGVRPEAFFSRVIETKYRIPDAVTLLKAGQADAAVLGNCEYERLLKAGVIRAGDYRILSEKEPDGLCRRSTDRYPDVVFSSLPTISSSVIREVAVKLLTMPTERLDFQWTVASEFRPTYELMKSLNISPFRDTRPWTLQRLWTEYRTEILLGLAFLLAVLFHIVTINLLVKRRTEELSLSVKETERYFREAQENRHRLMSLERQSIVSQLSSMFAHEIKQPITNIGYYVGTLRMILRKEKAESVKSDRIFEGIEEEIKRSAAIVEHVRSYAKKRPKNTEVCVLSDVSDRAVAHLPALTVERGKEPDARVLADSFELEFIVSNFLRNAASAVEGRKDGRAALRIEEAGDYWKLSVSDNGPELSDEAFKNLGKVGHSTKRDGLGFGLAIATAIAESNNGHLEFEKNAGGGLTASLLLRKYTAAGAGT